jgi:2-phosphosulfolactate phosphatase
MRISVRHFPAQLDDAGSKQIVVIDVLRATSVIVTALAHHARAVVPVDSVEEAREAARRFDAPVLLGGERHNQRIEGFECGNSPSEYTEAAVHDAVVILATTNGTRALAAASAGDAHVTAAALYNVNAIAHYLASTNESATLYCAGTEGRYSLEDAFCAGAIAHRLHARGAHLEDEAIVVAETFAAHRHDAELFIAQGSHAQRLIEQGFERDVVDCCAIDRYDVVPLLVDGMLKARL